MLKKFQAELVKLQEQPEEKRRKARVILVTVLIIPLVLVWLISLRFIGGFRLKKDNTSNSQGGFNGLREEWVNGKEGVGKAIEALKEENQTLKSQMEQITQEKESTQEAVIQNQETPVDQESLPAESN